MALTLVEQHCHNTLEIRKLRAASFPTRLTMLTHEFAHAMIAGIARRGVPAWLHEGLATYFEPADVSRAEQRLRTAGIVVPLRRLEDGFARFEEREAQVAYDQSLVAASVLVERLGPNLDVLLYDLDRGNEFSLALTRLGFAYPELNASLRGA